MNTRDQITYQLENPDQPWDVVIIGGGATGLGTALESVTRGFRTVLLEQHDFAKGTSSRSTKLIHGGVRYLAQGNIPLVIQALRERGRLKRNAPHLVWDQGFVIPCYSWWCIPFYTIGLTFYDLLAGKLGIGRSRPLSRRTTLRELPGIKPEGLRGGVKYHDCQFDDARMAVNLSQTVRDRGGVVLNYARVNGIVKEDGKVSGVTVEDMESGRNHTVRSRSVINATGVFVDAILKMDDPAAEDMVKPSQGVHLVVDHRFMNGNSALMIPRTGDGRVLFALPWHGRLVVGTTDVEKHKIELEPYAEVEEVDYILETAGRYLVRGPDRKDVLSVYTGLRPLAAYRGDLHKTKEISRRHKIVVSPSGLVTVTGGKWTTYRQMAEDVMNRTEKGILPRTKGSVTASLRIHGYKEWVDPQDPYCWYGSDRAKMIGMVQDDHGMSEVLSEKLPMIKAQVVWAVREEMARTVEDVLSRRTRALQLDAGESIRIAPGVAAIMARELEFGRQWEKEQVASFTALARNYLLNTHPGSPPP